MGFDSLVYLVVFISSTRETHLFALKGHLCWRAFRIFLGVASISILFRDFSFQETIQKPRGTRSGFEKRTMVEEKGGSTTRYLGFTGNLRLKTKMPKLVASPRFCLFMPPVKNIWLRWLLASPHVFSASRPEA